MYRRRPIVNYTGSEGDRELWVSGGRKWVDRTRGKTCTVVGRVTCPTPLVTWTERVGRTRRVDTFNPVQLKRDESEETCSTSIGMTDYSNYPLLHFRFYTSGGRFTD